MQHIKTIIFDLGGVIINLYVERTITAFSQLSGFTKEEIETTYLSADIFKQYEKGLISDAEFRQGLRENFKLEATDSEINAAWNAMLGEIPDDRIESIKTLLKNYKCIVLSNTNSIHEQAFHKILSDSFPYQHLNNLFKEVYFSHELNKRKPDYNIYQEVLKRSETQASDSLFMDDGIANLEAASALGINTLHIPRNSGFMNLLQYKLSNL